MRSFKAASLFVVLGSTQALALHSYSSHPGQVGQVFSSEPSNIGFGDVVLVDDRSCPAGQIKEVTGGNRNKGIPRAKRCVPH